MLRIVAPHVGAWIETRQGENLCFRRRSHPMWVRGLKLLLKKYNNFVGMSHPMWVRGLKLLPCLSGCKLAVSHPMWVRGLKLRCKNRDEQRLSVAPHVGAWIETFVRLSI